MNTDNQQQTVSDFEIGWMSGLIEGEGSIVLLISKRKGRTQQIRIIPRVLVANSDQALIEKYVDILSRLGIGRYIRYTRPNNLKVSKLFQVQGIPHKFKDMTMVSVEGFKRIFRLLNVIMPYMFGEKKLRASLLLEFLNRRMINAEQVHKGPNYSYDEEDVNLLMKFIELTNSPRKDKIAGMLNEHTREAKRENRRLYKKNWHIENRERETELQRLRRSRCALDS